MQTYTVGYGDSVSKISKILYGDFSKTQEICKLNNLVNCNLVQPGQVLKVPDATNVKDAEVIPLNASATGGWEKTAGKWFPWIIVGVAAYFITKEAAKKHKKNKATKTKSLGSVGGADDVEFWKKQFKPRTKKWRKETLKSLKAKKSPFDSDEQRADKISALEYLKKHGIDGFGKQYKLVKYEGSPLHTEISNNNSRYQLNNMLRAVKMANKTHTGNAKEKQFWADALKHAEKKLKRKTLLDGLSGKKNKLSKQEAKRMAVEAGINFNEDYHILSSSKVERLVELAKKSDYQKSKSSSGSRGRAFFYHLQKVK